MKPLEFNKAAIIWKQKDRVFNEIFYRSNPSFRGLPPFSRTLETNGLSNFTPQKPLLSFFNSDLSYLLTPHNPIYPRLDVQAKRFVKLRFREVSI